MFTFCLFSTSATAAPVNDNYANAVLVNGTNGTVMTTNVGATKETGEANVGLNRGGASVWYKWVAPGNGVLKVDTQGTAINTVVGIYVGGSIASATLVAGGDYCDCAYVGTQTGVTYYISLDGTNSGSGALQSSIQFNYTFLNAAPNDNFANATQLFDPSPTRTNQTTTSNVGAGKEIGEPNHAGNAGGKSVWFKWQSAFTLPRSMAFSIDNVKDPNAGNSHVNSLMAIYTGSSVSALTPVQSYNAGSGKFIFIAQPNTTYYIAIDGYDAGQGADTGTFTITWGLNKSTKMADFDRDGEADIAVFRPTSGTWYSLDTVGDGFRAVQWGANGDKPLISDANHNGKSDYTVYRPDTGAWYFNRDNSFLIFGWGVNTDIPLIYSSYSPGVPVDTAVNFRPQTGEWWFASNGADIKFGQLGDIPVTADFDGDGTDEIAVFRPSNGAWYIWNLVANQYQFTQFGLNGDKPVVADYDRDGRADIAVYRPSTGVWYVLRSTDGDFQAVQFGASSDKPQPADYDGDGRADYAVYRNGQWWILPSFNHTPYVVNFGLSTDIPVTAPVN